MSIIDEIAAHETTGALVRFQPPTRRPLRRELFLTAEAVENLNDRNSAVNLLVGRGRLIAAMERWVRGERVYSSGRDGNFLKRLVSPPPEIWEIRVTEPVDQARLFVRFACPNCLIVTHLHTRASLGRKIVRRRPSSHGLAAMKECEATWNRLFPNSAPFSGRQVRDYISENRDDFDLQD